MSRRILKLLNGIYGWIISTVIVATAVYAGYSIWDNFQIYKEAKNVQEEVRSLKPDQNKKDGPDFDRLRAINQDVIAWLKVNGTNIDNPVLQGKTNFTYMDKDVYGNFSLAGSLFLDIRNKADFSDRYSLIYGHNMDEHLMFGDLALFKDKQFFKKHAKATLMIPRKTRNMNVAAVMQSSAGTKEIFDPDIWKGSLNGFGEFLEKNSIWYDQGLTNLLKTKTKKMAVVALVTCSDGSTNDRTILILIRQKDRNDKNLVDGRTVKEGKMSQYNRNSQINGDGSDHGKNTHGGAKTGDQGNEKFWVRLMIGIIAVIGIIEAIGRRKRKIQDYKK